MKYQQLYNMLTHETSLREQITPREENEWGFPKGRRMVNEIPLACALREFEEETGISGGATSIVIDHRTPPQIERFRGTNGMAYKNCYYRSYLYNDSHGGKGDVGLMTNNYEIANVRWMNKVDIIKLHNPHYQSRLHIINNLD